MIIYDAQHYLLRTANFKLNFEEKNNYIFKLERMEAGSQQVSFFLSYSNLFYPGLI